MESERLLFGKWQSDDFDLINHVFGDPIVTRFEGGDWSRQQVEDRLRLEISTLAERNMQYWPIFLKENGEFVGCCGLRPHDPEQNILELGCQLRRAFWSMSFGREAGKTVIAYAFGHMKADALYAGHHPDNTASSHFLKHLGFEHTHDEIYPLTGLMEPCYLLTHERYTKHEF
ncbi:GNAT family N-acetyltransferase [Burkholderia sp. 22PA0106]|uniref:GNAT family N-acetyltransferase n=1 Tax=Burkholderia sp. 22PA0106 TaxID=3237371 RepID=UPI0039C1767F